MMCLEFWSEDEKFGLRLDYDRVTDILRLCQAASPNETGGILLGRYNHEHDCAVVTNVRSAPSDSKSGRTWFIRGVRGLQRLVDRFWQRERIYYLGEWHFHPFGSPCPSPTDANQMREIALSPQYHCPEPVLLIIGGNPVRDWSAVAYVFPRDQQYVEMFRPG